MQLGLVVYNQLKGNFRVGQGQPFHQIPNVPSFCLGGFQELPPCRRIVEKVAYQKGGALRGADFFPGLFFPALNDIAGAAKAGKGLGNQLHLGNCRNAAQRFPPEPKGGYRQQILHIPNFAGGMAQEGKGHFFRFHAAPIVRNAEEGTAALLDFHSNGAGFGVYGVFNQLLYHGGGALNDFTCCNFVNGLLV